MKRYIPAALAVLLLAVPAGAGTGDPQLKTDHPWYPGELACSTFERLFATQAELYKRVVGVEPRTDEQKALASWLWRNAHYWHATEGTEDLWGKGFQGGSDLRTRDYWTGLFSHGFGLCGTTHSQWTAEMEYLLGHARGRGVGVDGHNSFEVFLTGGKYGAGKWVLLDHDISTVIFDEDGSALLSIPEVKANLTRLSDPAYKPEKQHGWIVSGLHPKDAAGVFTGYYAAEYLAGYAGAPPIVNLRRGETFRRYLQPGLEDGKTFVFWGMNYNSAGIPGPERPLTWVNQPEKIYKARSTVPYKQGQARYANAVYTYKPDFKTGDYKHGVVDESESHVTFEFYSPYLIGCTPPNSKEWAIYDDGGKNGLVLRGRAACPVSISTDQGRTWKDAGAFKDGLDLTDRVKGRRQYFLKLGAGAKALAGTDLTIRTVCQANASVMPRLKDGGTKLTFAASGRAVVSAGPEIEQARTRIVEGGFPSPRVTMEVSTPRKEPVAAIHAVAHLGSGNPPNPGIKYQIEYSLDGGKTWLPVVKDWTVPRRGDEPADFWSQSLCYGSVEIPSTSAPSARVRFHNSGGRQVMRAEVHVVYKTSANDPTKVTFDWTEDSGAKRESRTFAAAGTWDLKTGKNVRTRWVEFEPSPGR